MQHTVTSGAFYFRSPHQVTSVTFMIYDLTYGEVWSDLVLKLVIHHTLWPIFVSVRLCFNKNTPRYLSVTLLTVTSGSTGSAQVSVKPHGDPIAETMCFWCPVHLAVPQTWYSVFAEFQLKLSI